MSDNMTSYIEQNEEKIHSLLTKRLEKSKKHVNAIPEYQLKEYDVSSMQKHMLEREEMHETMGAYNLAACVNISGKLDLVALEMAISSLIKSNSSLRTKFIKTADGYRQYIEEDTFSNIEYIDISNDNTKILEDIITARVLQKMQLNMPVLLKVTVINVEHNKYVMLLVTHHAVADGWSFGVIIGQLQEYYNSYRRKGSISLFSEKINYIDYIIWKRHQKTNSKIFWIEELNGTQILRLESDWDRSIQATYKGRRIYFEINQNLLNSLRRFAELHKVTLSNIIMAAYQILLSKYTKQKDFVVGMVVAGRENLALSKLIGCFINTLGMRTIIDENMQVKDYLDSVQEHFYEIMKHREIDIYDCLDDIQFEKDYRFPPLFQAMYNFENTPKTEMDFDDLVIDLRNIEVCNALFDLTLSVFDTGIDLTGFIEYKSELFKKERIEQLLQCFLNLLENIMSNPELLIKNVSLLSIEQETEVMNYNSKESMGDELFVDRFKRVVSECRYNNAVCTDEISITYEQLDAKSYKVAYHLLKQTGQKALIGVFIDKSIEAIVSILSILRAGMTYVPIDTGYPEERIQYIISDARIDTVLTCKKNTENINMQSLGIKNIIYIEDMLDVQEVLNEEILPATIIAPNDTAYIIYTSGSTGEPKGVMVPHRGLCNVIDEQKRLFEINENSRVLQFASFCFDASIFEILMALGNGATLYVVDKQKVLGNPLAHYIRKNEITHICVTPSVLALTPFIEFEKLETIIVAGEACPDELVKIWGETYNFFNAYGPTEATIWTTTAKCVPNKKVTIGKPLNNVEVYVLDNQLNLVPRGCEGELYIGGIGLCNGYLHREEMNRQKFIQKKFSNGYETTLYASGDMVRWNDEGELEFLGRKDNQVKLRGFRIETDEIRAKILEYPNVQDVVIGITKTGGTDVLYAVIKSVPKNNDIQSIKEFLQKKLPYYMVPSIFGFLDEIPLTWNGKVDIERVESNLMAQIQEGRGTRKAETEIQQKLIDIWKNVLALEVIGTDDNFFEVGGHSLIATKLANCISEELQVEFSTGMVFSYPTILEMEECLKNKIELVNLPIVKAEREREIKLAPQQKQLWFMEQMYPQNGSYNIVMPIQLKGKLNVSILEKSFCRVIDENEILRVNFYSEGGIPYQKINKNTQFRLSHYYLMNFESEQIKLPVNTIIRMASKHNFDLDRDLLIRALLIHMAEEEFVLVIIMHHIISDGWSMELIVDEITKYYNQYKNQWQEDEYDKNNVKLGYIDYIYWLETQEEKWNKQKQFWRETLSSEMDVVSIPTDYKRPEIQTHNGYTVEMELDEQITLQIKEFCVDKKITIFMFMLMIYSVLLHKLTGNSDIPIGVPVAGRLKKEMEDMIGFFVNTLVMRCNINENNSMLEYLDHIKEISLLAYENQDVPFEELVQTICRNRDISRSPLVQVMLNVQNPNGIQCYMDNVEANPYPFIQENTKFDLTLYVEEYFKRIKLRIVYNSDLFKISRMQEFLRQFCTIMNTVLLNENVSIDEISVQSSEFRQVLQNNMTILLQNSKTVQLSLDEIVAENAKKYADRIAVLDETERLTYLQLDIEAKKLAFALSERNISKGSIVIIYGARSVKLIVSILAILKTGASFCIFDAEYPEERLKKQFEVVDASGVIVINNKNSGKIKFMYGATLRFIETYENLIDSAGEQVITRKNVPKDIHDTAYVLFTSGTTGVPNCVCTSHAPVIHFIKWFISHYSISEDCIFGLFAGLSHDPLIREVFTPLFVGGRLAIQNQESKYDLDNCSRWINEQRISEVNITPSLFMMITEGRGVYLPSVRHYFFGGEILSTTQIQRAKIISPNAKCANFYGATETPQVMGYYDVPNNFDFEKDVIPIQKGIDEVRIFLVNKNGVEAGVGELGEIFIETPYLSKGYLNNEELNKEKFVDSKDKVGWRVYKTGDVGRYQDDGSFVIEGRKDNQINIRGYRVEAKEIEMVLLRNENVRNVVVCARNVKGRTEVVAYLVVNDPAVFEINEMRHFLMNYIPVNVLPERFILMESIPLTPNGKVDYRKLPYEFEERLTPTVKPKDEAERKIMKIWSDVLKSDNFGVDDNFFDVGGHSLLLAQIKVLLEQEFKVELKLVDLFSYPTIAMLSKHIGEKRVGIMKEVPQRLEEVKVRAKKRYQSLEKFRKIKE